MILRTLVVYLYIVACVIAVAADYFLPQLNSWLLAGLLGWLVIGFFVYRLPAMSRPVGFGSAPVEGRSVVAPPRGAAPSLEFCAYCATPIEPGTPICPACQRTIPVI